MKGSKKNNVININEAYENTTIPIFFAIDDNYAKFLQITLKSIIDNASEKFKYQIYVLNSGISEESESEIKTLENENFSIEFVNVTQKLKEISNSLFVRDYYSCATYYRIFIPDLFPHLDKAIYLDSDIVLKSDISSLFFQELADCLVGAVPDESVQLVDEFIAYVENFLGIAHERYFNAGMLLMNLKEMRKFSLENKFLNLLEQIKFIVAQDQDYLNVLCKDRVKYLDCSWNKMPFDDGFVEEKDINLIHFNLSFKPWHYDDVLYEKYFYQYVEKLNMREFIESCKKDFDDEKKFLDQKASEKLKSMTKYFSCSKDNYVNLILSKQTDFKEKK